MVYLFMEAWRNGYRTTLERWPALKAVRVRVPVLPPDFWWHVLVVVSALIATWIGWEIGNLFHPQTRIDFLPLLYLFGYWNGTRHRRYVRKHKEWFTWSST